LTLPVGPSDDPRGPARRAERGKSDSGSWQCGAAQSWRHCDYSSGALPGVSMTEVFITGLFVLMLSTFLGLDIIRRVSRLLHTPLMSLTNAISAIAIVGSLVIAGQDHSDVINILGAVAIFASMTNIVSGFLITDRMLKMFKGQQEREPK
jgi:H+-translocating NAD(P) transhydrogenase subunit alpha